MDKVIAELQEELWEVKSELCRKERENKLLLEQRDGLIRKLEMGRRMAKELLAGHLLSTIVDFWEAIAEEDGKDLRELRAANSKYREALVNASDCMRNGKWLFKEIFGEDLGESLKRDEEFWEIIEDAIPPEMEFLLSLPDQL